MDSCDPTSQPDGWFEKSVADAKERRRQIAFIASNDVISLAAVWKSDYDNDDSQGNELPARNNVRSHKAYLRVTERDLGALFVLHDRLMDVSEVINRCYAINTMAYVTVAFVYTIFGIFFGAKLLRNNMNNGVILSMIASSYILWSIQYIVVMTVLLKQCKATREAAYDTTMAVHKILVKKPLFLLETDFYYTKMKSFSLHVLHRKKTYNFSGHGLFICDYTLIFSVGLTKTYLLRL